MAIQVRRGNEADFDASKMLPGEWAVSLDTKYVRMCFAPGVVLRMATYESFENDKAQIKAILAECKDIQSAVQRIQAEVNSKASLVVEYSNNAKTSADKAHSEAERAKVYADNAEAVTGVQIATKERAGLIKGGDNHIAKDGTLMLITTTDSTTQPNSYAGRENILEIGGVTEQETTAGNQLYDNSIAIVQGGINSSGSSYTADGYLRVNGYIPASGTSVTVSCNVPIFRVFRYSGTTNDSFISYLHAQSATELTVPLTEDTAYIRISFVNGDTTATDKTIETASSTLMVNYGDVALPLEKYTGGQPAPNPSYPMEIKKTVVSGVKTLGKNLLNLSTDRMNKLTYANGIYTSKPCGAWAMLQVYLINGVKMRVGKKYYLKAKIRRVSGSGEINVFALEPAKTRQMVNIPNLTDSFQEYVAELYVDSDSVANTVCTIQPNGTAIDLVLEIKDIILCEDLEADYDPYTESSHTFSQPIELYGKDGVQDVIGNGQIDRKYVSLVFDGSDDEAWQLSTTVSGRFYIAIWYKPNVNVLCTHATQGIKYDENLNKCYVATTNGEHRFSINTSFATLDEWKAHLASKPMEVVYQLAKETTEALPIADQIALNSLQTYDGITYVEFIYEGPQPTFKGEYGTSKVGGYTLEGMLAGRNGELYGQSYNERLSALEASVVNNI